MSDHLPRRTVIFIVRLWAEYLEQTPPCWRGSVEHVPSGQRLYFVSLDDLNDFLLARLDPSGKHAESTPRDKGASER